MVQFCLHSLLSMELEMEMQLHAYTWYQIGHKEVSVVVVLLYMI